LLPLTGEGYEANLEDSGMSGSRNEDNKLWNSNTGYPSLLSALQPTLDTPAHVDTPSKFKATKRVERILFVFEFFILRADLPTQSFISTLMVFAFSQPLSLAH
jgi:hypothetical protein